MARTEFHDEKLWSNWHGSLKDIPIAGRFEILNSAMPPTLAKMAESAVALQQLIGRAIVGGLRLRAQGATWSFSEAPAVPGGWVLDTGLANWLFPVPQTHVVPGFSGDRSGLVLTQTGISVSELNMHIEQVMGRSLTTTGASNGQTLVGAMSTGTHGSAIDHPAIQSQIVAIQLLPGPDRNLWIERASHPVTDGRIAAALGATVERDDRLFEAVLVGLGAFGIVHSVVIETVPRFLVESNRLRIPLSAALDRAMTELEFENLPIPHPDTRPYFFQSVVNPHIDADGAYITTMVKQPWDDAHQLTYDIIGKRSVGYNLAAVVAEIANIFPGIIKPITKVVLADQLKPINAKLGSWGQSFNFTTPRAGVAGSSMAVPAERTLDALQAHGRALARVGTAPVAFACRYVRKSPGLIAFTKFPKTCVIDTDGIDADRTHAVMREVATEMRASGIPHAEHWGKLNQMTAQSVRETHGTGLEDWLKARDALLDKESKHVFGSSFLDRLGMTSAVD